MQADETLPLDFSKSNTHAAAGLASGANILSVGDNESKGLFDGVASSEMQPDSDVISNNWPETSSEEESDGDDASNFMTNFAQSHDDMRAQEFEGEIG